MRFELAYDIAREELTIIDHETGEDIGSIDCRIPEVELEDVDILYFGIWRGNELIKVINLKEDE